MVVGRLKFISCTSQALDCELRKWTEIEELSSRYLVCRNLHIVHAKGGEANLGKSESW